VSVCQFEKKQPTVGIVYVWRHAKNVRINPELSLGYDPKSIQSFQHVELDNELKTTKIVLVITQIINWGPL
jgi:hypothetical protein